MPLQTRIALTMPGSPDIEDTIARIEWAEANGIPDVWFADAGAPDTLTRIAAVARHARTVRVGVAVTPVYTRTPAVIAASTYVLEQLLPGRFVLGLGASSQTIMQRWNGIPLEKPLTRVRETALLVRQMLAGEKTNFDGETVSSHGYSQPALAHPSPIYLAALRPRMIEMAAEIGDGVIFNLWPRRALPRMMEHVRVGASRAGRDWRSVEIVNRVMALCTADKPRARDIFRASFAPYYATGVYNSFLAWSGFKEAARGVTEGWAAKDRAQTAAALSDDLIDEIAVLGTAEEIAGRIRADAAGGVHTHIIAPLAGTPDERQATFEAFSATNFRF